MIGLDIGSIPFYTLSQNLSTAVFYKKESLTELPLERPMPQTEGSELPLPSGHPYCGNTFPLSECENGLSALGRSEQELRRPQGSEEWTFSPKVGPPFCTIYFFTSPFLFCYHYATITRKKRVKNNTLG
jgi:hypothetical protein